jgi:1,4-alpha-glucan branching enzyme
MGTYFAVWAPDAERVVVMGDFNDWDRGSHPLQSRGQSGIWEGFVPGVGRGARYKYEVLSRHGGYRVEKSDPFAFSTEVPPKTASVVWESEYAWGDRAWMEARHRSNALNSPMAIYEVHLGSWMRVAEDRHRPPTYREAAPRLAEYVQRMGFTHVEFLPIMEHPFYGSWGYQTSCF